MQSVNNINTLNANIQSYMIFLLKFIFEDFLPYTHQKKPTLVT